MRLDIERQKRLEPERIEFAKKQLAKLGINVLTGVDKSLIWFYFKGACIKFYPYSGWHSGKSIKDGRGLNKLLKQIIGFG